ncbi:hypothetical protein JCM15831A_06860 [Asaia astilbis]
MEIDEMRLLLVESDQATALSLIKTLKQGGITVDHARTGHEAIDMLRHYDYDLALTELTLEDLEGYEVIRRVRKTLIQTPIIVLSGLNRPQNSDPDADYCLERTQSSAGQDQGFSRGS